MLNSPHVRFIWRSLNWLTRLAIVATAIMSVSIAVIIIMLRYVLLPGIEAYHDTITSSLSAATGNPVTIGKIAGDWMGFRPHLDLSDVRILDEHQQPALVFPRIEASVSWTSLFAGELRLDSLDIERPELQVRCNSMGELSVGGMKLSAGRSDNKLSNWLLHQSSVVVRDAQIIWVDEQRDALPLVLKQVNLRIENSFGQHGFALRAVPPEEFASPLDMRGELEGESFDRRDTWYGQIFTQFEFADASAWKHWLDLPREFSNGRGAVRGWLGVQKGKISGVTADLALSGVVAQLAEDLPEMQFDTLRGRVVWQTDKDGNTVSTHGLSLRMQDGLELQPTDFYLHTGKALDSHPASFEVRANSMQLETLARLSAYFPLDTAMRTKLDEYAPTGKISGLDLFWQGKAVEPERYRIKGQFEDIGIRQVGNAPGISGLTLDIEGDENSGKLNVDSRRLTVDAPGILREPLQLDALIGQLGWQRKNSETVLNVDNVIAINDDLAGNVQGSYQTSKGSLGVLDLTVNLTRGDIRRAARYTPLIALERPGNDWLNDALQAGHTEDFYLHVRGNLSDFPPRPGNDVLFEIRSHIHNAVLEFDKAWPRIENISGIFTIRGNHMGITATSATMAGAYLQNVKVDIPDMLSKVPVLEISGQASASTRTFLQFIQNSPVRGYIDGVTDGISAIGDGRLDLSLHIPLDHENQAVSAAEPVTPEGTASEGSTESDRVHVAGKIRLQNNDIDLGKGVPLLVRTSGRLTFTESGMQAKGVSARILGGPASIDLKADAGSGIRASIEGHSNMEVFFRRLDNPLLQYVQGGADWTAQVNVMNKSAHIIIASDMRGISSTLPRPFAKNADEPMALRIEKSPAGSARSKGQSNLSVRFGDLIDAQLVTAEKGGESVVRSGIIQLGAQSKHTTARRIPKSGIWLTGNLPELSIQGWSGLSEASGGSPPDLPISRVNLSIDRLSGYGQHIDALQVTATKRVDGLDTRLTSEGLKGEVVWQPHGYENGGKISARIQNLLTQPDDQSAAIKQPVSTTSPSSAKPDGLPALDVSVENLQIKGKQIGRFELVGYPEGKDWRLRRLHVTNPDGSLLGDGLWQDTAGGSKSQLNLSLEISDAGKILDRSGYPNTVKGGSGKLVANLNWAGTPEDFNYATLNGTLRLDTANGRFLKMDPGAGKLLSILSMQALPKRFSLDFNDVFREGFQFDNIIGDASIKDGVMSTEEFHVYGSSAKVALKGSVDLNHETQDLSIRVFPAIGDSVSLLALFAVNPAVGIGSLIANTVLGNPLDKLVSFEYNVSGTWSNPNVDRVKGATPKNNEIN